MTKPLDPRRILNAIPFARTTSTGSPEYDHAVAICLLRGLEPFAKFPDADLLNWEAVIAEWLVMQALADELANRSDLPPAKWRGGFLGYTPEAYAAAQRENDDWTYSKRSEA